MVVIDEQDIHDMGKSSMFRDVPHDDGQIEDTMRRDLIERALFDNKLQEKQLKLLFSRWSRGSYGSVYLGKLHDGKQVAVKVRFDITQLEADSFINEPLLLNQRPTTGLRLLPGGTLTDNIYETNSKRITLSWVRRLKIAIDAAKGLDYLHNRSEPRIMHRDVKSINILLDGDLNDRVCDFGLSKQVLQADVSHLTTMVKGTAGYLDPEYYITQQLTEKSDIYSFGVVLLELICGRSPLRRIGSPSCIKRYLLAGNLEDIFLAATHEYAAVVEELWNHPAMQATYKRTPIVVPYVMTSIIGLVKIQVSDPFRPLWDVNPVQRVIYGVDWLPDPSTPALHFLLFTSSPISNYEEDIGLSEDDGVNEELGIDVDDDEDDEDDYLKVTHSGPGLYYMDSEGGRLKGTNLSVGSGSPYAYDVLDSRYHFDMTVDEAAELARRSIYHATFRDGARGGVASGPNGWTKLSGDDVGELHYSYYPVEPATF
ncbi:probable LRR receptor-like serine/threonine-protein kinase isoform X1 [Tanacetum coccineum]